MTRHNLWEKVFCVTPIVAQSHEEFQQCKNGTRRVFMRSVWRQDIVRSSYTHKEAMYRYVDMIECPQPGHSIYEAEKDYYGNR